MRTTTRSAAMVALAASCVGGVMAIGGCARGSEPAQIVVPAASPEMRRFARAAGAALAEEIERQPAIAGTSGPWAVELGPIADRTRRDDAADIARTFQLELAGRVPAYVLWQTDRVPTGAATPPALLRDEPGRPHRDEQIFVLDGSLESIDRPGTLDDVLYFDLRLTNAATRVTVLAVQLDSRQYGGAP